METYYTLLDIPASATAEEITAAYQRQRERYSPERVAALGDEFRSVAERRLGELERAYAVLSDEEQRRAYDRAVGAGQPTPRPGTGVSARELRFAAAGLLAGLAIIAAVWFVTGRTAAPELPAVGEMNRPAPDVALAGLDGGTLRLSDYRGKVVLVNFWGTWCEPCKEETPALQSVYTSLKDEGLVIVGINLIKQETGGSEAVRAFLKQYGVTYLTGLDTDGEAARQFNISPIPTSYFIDPAGNIRYVRVGTLTQEEVAALFSRLRQDASALR